MAKVTEVRMIDDLSGKPGDDVEEINFAVDGNRYTIDLGEANAAKLGKLLDDFRTKISEFTNAATKVKPKGGKRSTRATSQWTREDRQSARVWLRSQGHDIGEKGLIKADLFDMWVAAGSPAVDTSQPTLPGGEKFKDSAAGKRDMLANIVARANELGLDASHLTTGALTTTMVDAWSEGDDPGFRRAIGW